MNKKPILSVLMAFLIVSSGVVGALGAVGTVSAQSNTDSTGDSIGEKCVDSVEGWGVLVPAVGIYQCIDGAFNSDNYDSSTELENEAWNNAVSIQDYAEERDKIYTNWNDRSQSSALQTAEEPLIEAHYAGDSEGDARSDASEAIRQYYSAQLSNEYNANNQVYERSVSISKYTNADETIDPVVQYDVAYKGDSSTLSSAGTYEWVTTTATQDTTLAYETKTLQNGEDMEVVSSIKDVSIPDSFSDTISDGYALKHVDTDSDGTPDQYNVDIEPDSVTNSEEQVEIIASDPYSSETRTISWTDAHADRKESIKSEFNSAQGEVEQMATDLYSTHATGTINPDDYVSAATLVDEYSQNDSHYSYSAAKASLTGLQTDLSSQQIVQINGEDKEYEGMILTGSEGPAIADSTVGSSMGLFNESSAVLQYDSNGQATLTISNTDTTTSDTVYDASTDTLTTSLSVPDWSTVDTIYVQSQSQQPSANDLTASAELNGNDISTYTNLDATNWSVEIDVSTTTASSDTVNVTVNGVTGISEGDDIQLSTNAYSSDSYVYMTKVSTPVSVPTIGTVSNVDSSGVSISDDGSSVTLDKSAVGDYALINVSDGDTYVAYTDQNAADSGVPTGFEVGQQYTASNFGSVMLTYQNGDNVETLREDTIDTFTIVSASSAETGEELDVLSYDDGGQRTFTDTSNIREELKNQGEVQDVIGSRGDVDPGAAGGSGSDIQQRISDALLGGGVVFIILFFIGGGLLVLYLAGKVTSVA